MALTWQDRIDAINAAKAKVDFNKAIDLYGWNISSVNTWSTSTPAPTNFSFPAGWPTAPWSATGIGSVWSSVANGVTLPWVILPKPTQNGANTPDNLNATKDSNGNVISTTTTTVPVQNGANTGVTGTDTSPGILTYDELSTDMKTYLDNNPTAKAQFDLQTTYGQQQQAKFLADAEKAVVEYKKVGDYNASQASNQLDRKAIQDAAGERQLQQGINNTKSNTHYSSLSSAPSAIAGTAAHGRIVELTKQFDEFVRLNSLEGDAYTESVAEQARRLQEDLNAKIGETLAEKLVWIDNWVANWTIATPEQLDRIFKENSAAIMREVPALTNFAVQALSDLQNNFMNTQKELRDNKIVFDQNANKYNAEMSQVQGFAVDGNGNQILDVSGKPIEIPKDAPLPAQFDAKTGQLITFSTNENGTIVGSASQIQGYKPPVTEAKRNIVMVDGKPYDVDQERFLNIPWSASNNTPTSTPFTPPTNFSSRWANQSIPVTNTGDGIEIGIPSGTKLEGIGGQCGWFTNDYGQNIPWYKPVGDSFESKLANNNSSVPVAWGMAMWTPGKFEDNGHIGIVEKVFADGSFQFYDTNYVAKNTTSRRIIKPWDAEYNLIQKTGGFFDPNKVGGQTGWNLQTLGQYMKDNQDRWAGYSNDDVKAFNEKIDRQAKNGDLDGMAVSYRNMVMKDKDFKQEFDNTQKFTTALDDVQIMISAYENAGKSTGALKSMAEKVARKLGMTTDTALAQLQTQMWFTLANYIRSISGTAASDVEVQRLMGNMASIGNVEELNTALVEQARNNATSALKSMIDTRMYGLPEDLKPLVFGDIYTTNTGNMGWQNTQSQSNNPAWI